MVYRRDRTGSGVHDGAHRSFGEWRDVQSEVDHQMLDRGEKRMIHLHSVIISYNRPELTRQAYETYLATVSVPHSLLIVDNGSDEETQEFLRTVECDVLTLQANHYPGYATNHGWKHMPAGTTHLHRADND